MSLFYSCVSLIDDILTFILGVLKIEIKSLSTYLIREDIEDQMLCSASHSDSTTQTPSDLIFSCIMAV